MPTNKSSIELGNGNQTRLAGRPVTGAIYAFVPAIDQFLKGHLFGDIFGRDNLDFQSREIATIAALANMKGVNSLLLKLFRISLPLIASFWPTLASRTLSGSSSAPRSARHSNRR